MPHKNLLPVIVTNAMLLLWEHWLARTERFVYGSTIELISAAVRWIIAKIKQKLF